MEQTTQSGSETASPGKFMGRTESILFLTDAPSATAWFTSDEDAILGKEVLKRQRTLFGKLNEGIRNPQRMAAWEEVTAAVNSIGVHVRTVDAVKKRHAYLKRKVKSISAANNRELSQTGGGKANLQILSPIDELIFAGLAKESIVGVKGGIDTSASGEWFSLI